MSLPTISKALARERAGEAAGAAGQVEDGAHAGRQGKRFPDRGPLARVALLAFGRAEAMEIVVLGDRRAAIEVALVVVAVFARPARITLAGFLHVGRHFNRLVRARKPSRVVQKCNTDLPMFAASDVAGCRRGFTVFPGSLRPGSPRYSAMNHVVTRITRRFAVMFVEFDRMSAIRVIQFTDPHLFGNPAETLRGVNTLETLERTLADASGHIWPSPTRSWSRAISCRTTPADTSISGACSRASASPSCAFPATTTSCREMRAALAEPPFELDGPADIGAWRFVLLDSVVANQAGGHISVEMLTKLDEDLGRARQRHAMVCLHHHPVAMSSRWLDNVGLSNANEFWSVIDSHPQVKAVVWGHVHQAFEGVAPRRAPARDAVDLRAVPAALGSVRHRQSAAGLSTAHAAFQRRHRYWRALADCRRIRGMTLPDNLRRGLTRGLAGLLLLASCAGGAQARGESSVWSMQGRAQHRVPRGFRARAAQGSCGISRAARARLRRLEGRRHGSRSRRHGSARSRAVRDLARHVARGTSRSPISSAPTSTRRSPRLAASLDVPEIVIARLEPWAAAHGAHAVRAA